MNSLFEQRGYRQPGSQETLTPPQGENTFPFSRSTGQRASHSHCFTRITGGSHYRHKLLDATSIPPSQTLWDGAWKLLFLKHVPRDAYVKSGQQCTRYDPRRVALVLYSYIYIERTLLEVRVTRHTLLGIKILLTMKDMQTCAQHSIQLIKYLVNDMQSIYFVLITSERQHLTRTRERFWKQDPTRESQVPSLN